MNSLGNLFDYQSSKIMGSYPSLGSFCRWMDYSHLHVVPMCNIDSCLADDF